MEMKRCTQCFELKPLNKFPVRYKGRIKVGHKNQCGVCVYEHRRRKDITEWVRQEARDNRVYRTQECKRIRDEFVSTGCALCPEKEACCMHCHHLYPKNKKYNISRLVSAGRVNDLVDELKKTIVLCANCHSKVHAGIIEIDHSLYGT